MTKVEELKKMYENMGGDPEAVADKTLITEMLDAMSELELSDLPDVTADDNGDVLTVVDGAWGKSTPEKELPAVTSEDNGNILSVVEGAWAKAAPPSSGGNIVIFDVTATSSTNYNAGFTLVDSTNKDIADAILAGKIPVLRQMNNSVNDPVPSLILYFNGTDNGGTSGNLYRHFSAFTSNNVGSAHVTGWRYFYVYAKLRINLDGTAYSPTSNTLTGSIERMPSYSDIPQESTT